MDTLMTPQIALALLLIIPLVAAAIIPIVGKFANIRETVTFIAGFALLAVVAYLCVDVSQGGRPELHFGSFAGQFDFTPVSYTHLTLPTNREV